MDHVLLVSSSPKVSELLISLLKSSYDAAEISAVPCGREARSALAQPDRYSLIIINAPLEDEFGLDLALLAARTTLSGIMLLVKNDAADKAAAKGEQFGVMVVSKPISRQMFFQALRLLQISANRLRGLQHENRMLQSKMEEIRMIGRAKCALIQYLNMTEPQAHRYIEKQAMDLRVTKMEVAQGILQTYES